MAIMVYMNNIMHTENSGGREQVTIETFDNAMVHMDVRGLFGAAGIWFTPTDARRLAGILVRTADAADAERNWRTPRPTDLGTLHGPYLADGAFHSPKCFMPHPTRLDGDHAERRQAHAIRDMIDGTPRPTDTGIAHGPRLATRDELIAAGLTPGWTGSDNAEPCNGCGYRYTCRCEVTR